MWLFFLLPVLASANLGPIATLKCFFSDKGTVRNVKRDKICAMELNLYNLGCLSPPMMTLYDVETVFATSGPAFKLGRNGRQADCFREDHYLNCLCTWDACNQNWTSINKMGKLDLSNEKLSKCIEEKCSQRDICSSYGSKGAKKFNHYPFPMEYTFNPSEKKNTKMNTIEMAILWSTGGGVLLAVISLVIYSLIAQILSPSTSAKEKKDAVTESNVVDKPQSTMETKKDDKMSTKKSEKKVQ